MDQQLQVATLQETVTVTGASPVVDTSTTQVGTNFTKELLTEIPNARDIWAAMAQAPGIQMTSYDVGGSRTGTQTGFLTYGFGDQNQTKLEGIDTTEGTGRQRRLLRLRQLRGVPGRRRGQRRRQLRRRHQHEHHRQVRRRPLHRQLVQRLGRRCDDQRQRARCVPHRQPARRERLLRVARRSTRGNPIDRQYDINFNIGGPLWKQKAWFFCSYRLNDQYKYTLGSDVIARSKLTNTYTFKGTFQLNRNNQLIGFLNKREKLQELRDFAPPLVPISAARYQASRNYPWKGEWTSVLGGRAFLDVIAGNWYNFFPLRPTDDYGFAATSPPGRIDTGTNQRTGYHDSYQDQKRYKPQVYVAMSYFKDGWKGSHDFKVGYDWKREQIKFFRGPARRQHLLSRPEQRGERARAVQLAEQSRTTCSTTPGYISDTWKVTGRLTINLGVRMRDITWISYPDQSFTPDGHAALANWPADVNPAERARYQSLIAPVTVAGREVASTFNVVAPRRLRLRPDRRQPHGR